MFKLRKLIYRLRGEISTEELINRGLKVGKNFKRLNGVIIDDSHSWLISIGDDVTLAPRVHILAHDASTKTAINKTRIGIVNIGSNVFIGAGSIVLPGVTIGDNVVIGAGSVVSKDIPSNSLALGNPAKVICSYDEYIERKKQEIEVCPSYDESYTMRSAQLTTEKKQQMIDELKNNGGIGYVD